MNDIHMGRIVDIKRNMMRQMVKRVLKSIEPTLIEIPNKIIEKCNKMENKDYEIDFILIADLSLDENEAVSAGDPDRHPFGLTPLTLENPQLVFPNLTDIKPRGSSIDWK